MQGIVISNKMQKALVVRVTRTKVHPKYKKRYKSRKNHMAACLNSADYKIGQTVELVSSRPISKNIKWKVLTK